MEAPLTRKLEFCFDFISPYSYVAFHALPGYLAATPQRPVYRPVFLGAIMQTSGNRPPGLVPAKGAYMQKDLERSCRRYGIGFRMNPHFPMMNTRPLLRVACALGDAPDEQEAFIRTIFHHVWAAPEPLKTDELDQVRAACNAEGLDGDRMVELAGSDEAKAVLIANTEKALERGAFGVPSFFVGDEMFFGHDRLDHAVDALRAA